MAYQVLPKVTQAGAAGVSRGFCAELWEDFDPNAMDRDPSLGFYDQDDFMKPLTVPANTAVTALSGRYRALTTNNTGAQIIPMVGQGGGISMENAASSGDNDEVFLQAKRGHVFASADEDDTWPYHHVARVRYECRFAFSSVADNENGWFCGFAGQALATGDLADNTAELVATFHGIGVQVLQADGNAISVVYQENGSAKQTLISLGAIVVNTWYSFGLDFNPLAKATERCAFYWNHEKQTTFLTHAQATAATFPISTDTTQILMGPTWLHKAGSDAASKHYVSQWRVCSELLKARGKDAIA